MGLVAVKPGIESEWTPANETEREVCSVWRMSVAESVRGRGVGTMLMQVYM